MITAILSEAETKMTKAVDALKEEFTAIRAGRASAAMFNKITVEYYGSLTPLQQLASFQVVEARTVLITPYDKSAMAEIDKALRTSDLGVNPTDDGAVIRVVLPVLTEERRKDFIKIAKTKAEESRVSVRNARRRAKEELDRMMRDGDAGKDDVNRAEKQLEVVTKTYVQGIDEALRTKESELLEV